MRNSRSNLGFVRILACRLDIICLRHGGTRLVVVFWVHFAPPCLEFWLRVILTVDRDAAIDCAPMPFCGHEQCSFLGWSFSVHGLRPVNLGHKFVVDFTQLRSCQLCCGSDRWIGLCCDSLPWKWLICAQGILRAPILPWNPLDPESQVIPVPVQRSRTTPTFNMRTNWENATWNKENTWGTRTWWGIAVIFMWPTPLGGHEWPFWG